MRRKTYDIDMQKALDIIKAAPMHDLGKISIDNAILCKPGKLTDEEFAIMKTHASKSGEIVRFILEGVEQQHFADVYDALVSKRCYKEAMSFEQAFAIMNDCMGSQFDPAMRPVFIACKSKLEKYYTEANCK